ncbi:hypothetical protein PSQ19_03790 [Devosia algicola]|uniref:Flagellar hook-length control protein-like C-terminal domain-containing protein n=1 Tax=Devosia algicola TaxID=3026418 RepID=A0ABY7YPW4_9HYPH|nr:hypothetical protein [Devosia algicola]WDR03289.1 hypothetical protein PSQ19_03790 [Devosia algicola]
MIPGQNPVQMAIRPGLLQTLALKPGQGFDAVVVGTTPSGATDVTVGKQHLTLSLQPSPAPGTTLQMRIDVTSAGPRFVILSQTPPDAGVGAGAKMAPPAVVAGSSAQPASLPTQPIPSSQPAAATIVERSTQGLPGSTLASTFKPGQIVEARVLGAASGGDTRVMIGQQTLNLSVPGPPVQGAIVHLRVETTPMGQRFVIASQSSSIAQTPSVGAATTQSSSAMATTHLTNAASAPPVAPQTELAAVTQMLQVAAGRQDLSIGLMNTLVAMIRDKSQLPPAVAQAVSRVLGARTDISAGKISGELLQKAGSELGHISGSVTGPRCANCPSRHKVQLVGP